MKKTTAILIGALCAATGIADSGTLTLEQALKLARENSPGLRAARLNTQATEKSVGAAGLWINPNVEVEVEGVGGDLDLFSESEYTVGLKQEFQRGGKRSKARAVALKSKDAASLVALEQELELDVRVRTAFIELAGQQETGKVRAEQEQLGRAFVEVAKQRHRAGGGSELDVVQAELALEEIILSQTCCFGDLEAAKVKMASLIGIPAQELVEVTAAYYELATLKDLAIGSDYPSLQRLEAEAEKARAEAEHARAQDTSNISLGAGYRYEAADDINTFLFSASMPLSFNKRGRAEHAAGMLRAEALQAGRDELHRQLQQELATLAALYKGACAEVELTKNKLMPKAEQAYKLSRAGYDAGRFSWLELIAAQQNLADIRIRYIGSLRDAHLAHARLTKFIKEGI